MTLTNIMLLKRRKVHDMTEGEAKQEDYATNRRSNVIRLSVNSAIHNAINIGILSNKQFWHEQNHQLWENIGNDAHSILGDLMLLKMKIETIIGVIREKEEEQ